MIKEGTVKITVISAKALDDPQRFSHLFDEINRVLVYFSLKILENTFLNYAASKVMYVIQAILSKIWKPDVKCCEASGTEEEPKLLAFLQTEWGPGSGKILNQSR